MSEFYWLYDIGPLDEVGAEALRERIQGELDEGGSADLIDRRVWFGRALDVESVRGTIPVLAAGLADESIPIDTRHVAMGLLSDMQTWLDREYDQKRDPIDESRG